MLGLEWSTASLSAYFEALEAHNEGQDPKAAGPSAEGISPELQRFMKAHRS